MRRFVLVVAIGSHDQPVSSPSMVRAVKDGYEIGTRTSVLTSDGRAYVGFSLAQSARRRRRQLHADHHG